MTRTLFSGLAAAAVLASAAVGSVPADAAKLKQRNKAAASSGAHKQLKTQSGTQQDKAHPNTIDVLSWSWGMSQGARKKGGMRAK